MDLDRPAKGSRAVHTPTPSCRTQKAKLRLTYLTGVSMLYMEIRLAEFQKLYNVCNIESTSAFHGQLARQFRVSECKGKPSSKPS